jgi:hypothetical protein
MIRRSASSILLLFVAATSVIADPPTASYIFPAGGQRGKSVNFRVGGLNLHDRCSFEMLGPGISVPPQLQKAKTVWFEGPLLPLPDSQQQEDYPKDLAGKVEIAKDAPLGVRAWRLWNSQGAVSARKFAVGELPEIVEDEIEGDPVPVNVKLPVTINGRIFPREDVDIWAFDARKGQVISAEVCAARLGSPLDSRLEVRDAHGTRIVENDDTFGADSFVRFTAPADGKYEVRIHDISFRGGQAYVYRLTLTADAVAGITAALAKPVQKTPDAGPDFQLQFAGDVLSIDRGGQGKLKVLAERLGGLTQPIALTVEGLPPGTMATAMTMATGQNSAEIPIKTEKSARIGATPIKVRGTAMVAGRKVVRTAGFPIDQAAAPIDTLLLAVTLPTPFKIVGDFDMRWGARGSVFHRRFRVERGGYQGALEVSLADHQARHLQGVTGPTILVPPGANSFDYAIQLPPWMETGRTCRVCVMAVGTIREADGSEHRLSFTSTAPNEQMIAVIEPGELGIEAGRSSLLVIPGKSVSLPVRVTHSKLLQNPVRVRVVAAEHLKGISTTEVVIPANRDSADLNIHFAANCMGPFNAPLIIQATSLRNGEPVVAETRVALEPGR